MLQKSSTFFSLLLFVAAICLYVNTLYGGYVWDDRAAIIANKDVQGINPLRDILRHDFWGQDITLVDSHKSFRPVTTISFRLNHYLHDFNAAGFHALNVLIYAISVVFYYWLVGQWVNDGTSRVAALIFCFHPVHVEAVASLVGRADSLCGAFYLLSIYLYTASIRGTYSTFASVVWLLFAYGAAFAASFSKEIGITIFGMFVALEAVELLKIVVWGLQQQPTAVGSGIFRSNGNNRNKSLQDHLDMQKKTPTSIGSLLYHVFCFPFQTWSGLLRTLVAVGRVGLSVLSLGVILRSRMSLVGVHTLYHWSILENHISLLPFFLERSLSYAQTHFWYVFKLVYPRYLCFDYGFACMPTVHVWRDPRNVLPLLVYGLVLGLGISSVQRVRVSMLVGLILTFLPLVPALNILFPVGTLLAERLLFVPSAGYSLVFADIVTNDLSPLWTSLATAVTIGLDYVKRSQKRMYRLFAEEPNSSSGSGSVGKDRKIPPESSISSSIATTTSSTMDGYGGLGFSAYWTMICLLILPMCGLFGIRIVTRNTDWNREISIYRSALEVCPLSVKALTNYGVLALSEGRTTEALVTLKTAISVHREMKAAHVNLGLAQQRVGDLLGSITSFETAKAMYADDGKSYSYLGALLLQWSSDPTNAGITTKSHDHQPSSSSSPSGEVPTEMDHETLIVLSRALRARAAANMDYALYLGHEPPALLHSRGSLAMDDGEYELAIRYLEAALRKNNEEKAKQDAAVTVTDGVHEAFTLNQLGNAYAGLNRHDEAITIFERAVRAFPASLPLRTNLGSMYRQMNRNDLARVTMEDGLLHCAFHNNNSNSQEQPQPSCPAALLNNLGLLELDERNFARAIELFEKALQEVGTHSEMRAANGESAVRIMQGNVEEARLGLAGKLPFQKI